MTYFGIQLALFHLMYRYNVRVVNEKITSDNHENMSKGKKREDEY